MSTDTEAFEEQLLRDLTAFAQDPLGFVRYAFPWGAGELAATEKDPSPGPDEWQTEVLEGLGKALRDGSVRDGAGAMRYAGQAIQHAVASGHGIGKTALICWVILWAMATFQDTRGVVTANTKTQLTTKTWAELAKWHRLFVASHWFKYEKTSLHSSDPAHEETWRIDAIPWSKNNPEAFAGLHNKGGRVLLVFDEASAIEDIIWETAEGATSDEGTEVIWLAFGNPTRNTGRFRECWRKFKHRWRTWQIDSRRAKSTNKAQLDAKVADYGEDSDYIKVRVRGIFPSVGDRQFIGSDLVDPARDRHIKEGQYAFAPKILSLDNAWTGGDEVVIGLRQGLVYRQLLILQRNDNDLDIAGLLARFEDEEKADGVFIDMGMGTGVYSAGERMGRSWTLVSFAGKPGKDGYLNKRAEMWGDLKEWLRAGGCIPDDQVLCDDLTGPEYIIRLDGKLQLESKDDMKERGLPSPNRGDALALTFAYPVQKRLSGLARRESSGGDRYDPLA